MNKIVQLFTNDTMLNDTYVAQFVKNHFHTLLKQPNVVGLNQFCKMLLKNSLF